MKRINKKSEATSLPKQYRLKRAAALKHAPEEADAPVLKAKGEGFTAHKMIEIAAENNIPILSDPALVELLYKLDLEQQIPPELYEVVAEILAMIYSLEKRAERHE